MQAPRCRRVSSASKLPDTPGSRFRRVGPSASVLRPKPRNPPPMVLWANHQTPRAAAQPPRQASSHKSFASGAQTAYSILPCSLNWPPRPHRLLVGFVAKPTKPSLSGFVVKPSNLACYARPPRQASGTPSLSPPALGRSTRSCPVQFLGHHFRPGFTACKLQSLAATLHRLDVGFVAKPTNPACKLRSLAATLHRLHRMEASVVSRYLAPARCWFCGQTNKPR